MCSTTHTHTHAYKTTRQHSRLHRLRTAERGRTLEIHIKRKCTQPHARTCVRGFACGAKRLLMRRTCDGDDDATKRVCAAICSRNYDYCLRCAREFYSRLAGNLFAYNCGCVRASGLESLAVYEPGQRRRKREAKNTVWLIMGSAQSKPFEVELVIFCNVLR